MAQVIPVLLGLWYYKHYEQEYIGLPALSHLYMSFYSRICIKTFLEKYYQMNNTPIAQQFMKYSQSGLDNVQYVYNGRTYKVTKEWIE